MPSEKTERSYWMVHCSTMGATSVMHATEWEAEMEAERLARGNPGRRFYVLKTTGFIEIPPDTVRMRFDGRTTTDWGVPF